MYYIINSGAISFVDALYLGTGSFCQRPPRSSTVIGFFSDKGRYLPSSSSALAQKTSVERNFLLSFPVNLI